MSVWKRGCLVTVVPFSLVALALWMVLAGGDLHTDGEITATPLDRAISNAREDAQRALPLVYGSALMLLLAAGIEAFWSAQPLAATVKYRVGTVLWILVLLYLLLAGRARVI